MSPNDTKIIFLTPFLRKPPFNPIITKLIEGFVNWNGRTPTLFNFFNLGFGFSLFVGCSLKIVEDGALPLAVFIFPSDAPLSVMLGWFCHLILVRQVKVVFSCIDWMHQLQEPESISLAREMAREPI